ncbi:MAG: LCP family protein [Clostridiales bacterium]|nr:LCP family protein [Clostridiales bacterium]
MQNRNMNQNGNRGQNMGGPYQTNGNSGMNSNGSYQNGPYQNGPYQNGPYQNQNYNSYQFNNGYPGGPKMQKKNKRGKRKVILFIIEVLVLLVLAVGLFVLSKVQRLNSDPIEEGNIIINNNISSVESEVLTGYTNIALFGVDARDGILKAGAHSDVIMIASINNATKDVKLVSVYRDTYLDNTNEEYRKATECYFYGGPERAINMLNKNLDLNIEDYVTVDFNAIATTVDALGGVDIDIQEDEVEHLNNYLVETSQVLGIDSYENISGPGMQHLDGLHALSYCRIRYTTGDDFKRTERQRAVLQQLFEKAKTMDILTLNNLADELLDMCVTSMTLNEILALIQDIASYNIVNTTGFPFNSQGQTLPDAGDCVVPKTLSENVLQLHRYLFGTDGYEPSPTVESISDEIIYRTGIQ